jgi:hypothetical protein
MRITRQILQKIAEDTVAERVKVNRNLLAVYLTGSVSREMDPVLGGTTDIDLVFVHEYETPTDREIIRLTEDIHLDIFHHTRQDYNQAKELRVHPQMGPMIYGCQIMHDPRHFLDFAQASVRAQFFRPDSILLRARTQLESARQVWFSFQFFDAQPGLKEIRRYLGAVADAAGAVASIANGYLTERRLLLEFFNYSNQIGKSGLYAGLLGLLGAGNISVENLPTWLSEWDVIFSKVGKQLNCPKKFHPYRFNYYKKGLEALMESERPMDIIWPLANTWSEMVHILPESHPGYREWEKFYLSSLLDGGFQERIQALDVYLDMIDETLENWGVSQGI